MDWNKLSMAEKADIMKLAVESGIYNLDTIRSAYNEFAEGGSIHIKPENRGKFTALKERTGHSATWFKEHGTPAQKKMATFALNARKWKHADGGLLSTANTFAEGGEKPGYNRQGTDHPIGIDASGNVYDQVTGEGGSVVLDEVTVSPEYAYLYTWRPLVDGEYKATGHSLLHTNFPYHEITNYPDPDSDDYNLFTNNCSDATRRALEKISGKRINPFLFTTPGDVKDFAENKLGGITTYDNREGHYVTKIPINQEQKATLLDLTIEGYEPSLEEKNRRTQAAILQAGRLGGQAMYDAAIGYYDYYPEDLPGHESYKVATYPSKEGMGIEWHSLGGPLVERANSYPTGGPLTNALANIRQAINRSTIAASKAVINNSLNNMYHNTVGKYVFGNSSTEKPAANGALGNQAFQNYLNQALQEDNTFNTPGGIKFLTDIAYAESRNNPYAAHNSGASGIFQTMPENTSKGAYGNPMQQFRDMFRLTKSNLNYLKKHLTKKDWDKAAELGIDEYGLLAGAHLGGVGGVVNALRGIKNAKDSNGTSVMSYMTRFSQNGKPALGNDITANPIVMGTTPETTFTPEQYQLIYGDNPYALPTASYAEETPIWPNPYGEAVVEKPSIQTVELSPVDFTQQNANNQRRHNLDVLGYVLSSSKSNRRNGSLYNTIQMISDEDSFNPLRLLRVGDFGKGNRFATGGNKKIAKQGNTYNSGSSSKGNHSQQMDQPNVFRRNGKYFYQESPDSEEITVTPVNTLFDDPALWTYTDNNGRLYTPRKAVPYTQGSITEKEDEGPLVEAAKNYLGELQYDINNGIPIGGKYTMPAIAASALLPLAGEAFAGTSIAGIPATTWADAALTAGFGAHGLNHVINEGIDGYGDAAMTALEIAPLGRLAKPIYEGVIQPGIRLFNSPLTGNWTRIGNREYRLSPNSLGASGIPIESRGIAPQITADNAASITPEQWDAAYNAALKSGDMKEVQRLRDLHFRVKTPNNQLINEFGEPFIMKHYGNKWTEFNPDETMDGVLWNADENAFKLDEIETFEKVGLPTEWKNLFINMEKPIYDEVTNYTAKLLSKAKKGDKEAAEELFKTYGVYNPDGLVKKLKLTEDALRKQGLDVSAEEIQHLKDIGVYGEEAAMSVAPYPNKIKLADAITYDDAGNIIPLSQRDNFNVKDIRYGLLPFGIGLTGYGILGKDR